MKVKREVYNVVYHKLSLATYIYDSLICERVDSSMMSCIGLLVLPNILCWVTAA